MSWLPRMNKRYIGDGVYVQVAQGSLLLTTENGISVTNSIYLEPEVLQALEQYLKELHAEVK